MRPTKTNFLRITAVVMILAVGGVIGAVALPSSATTLPAVVVVRTSVPPARVITPPVQSVTVTATATATETTTTPPRPNITVTVTAASRNKVRTEPQGIWDRLAQCESGGNWADNTGNSFYGGIQFTLSSWRSVGGTGLPSNASRSEQIKRGILLQKDQGWRAWPVCSRKIGLR